jgi:hypothetical protein
MNRQSLQQMPPRSLQKTTYTVEVASILEPSMSLWHHASIVVVGLLKSIFSGALPIGPENSGTSIPQLDTPVVCNVTGTKAHVLTKFFMHEFARSEIELPVSPFTAIEIEGEATRFVSTDCVSPNNGGVMVFEDVSIMGAEVTGFDIPLSSIRISLSNTANRAYNWLNKAVLSVLAKASEGSKSMATLAAANLFITSILADLRLKSI